MTFEEALTRGTISAFGVVFAAGVATSLTPCVYPMIPITVSLFGARDTRRRGASFLLASCYVGGIALTYSMLGVFAAVGGWASGSLLASRWFVIPLALFFVAMASSMFGLWKIQLPHTLTSRLSLVGGKGYLGAFAMGLVGGVLIAPCTGPVLAALLLHVARSGDLWLGASLLFTYALGIGVLFWVIAIFAVRLPRSGPWMNAFQSLLGVGLLVAALFYLQNVAPPLARYAGRSGAFVALNVGLVAAGLLAGAVHLSFSRSRIGASLRKALGIALLSLGLFGSVNIAFPPTSELSWVRDESRALALARGEGKPVLVDFWATWCVPCRELESEILGDPSVQRELRRFVLLKVDVSHDTEHDRAMKQKYGATELPQLVLLDSRGKIQARTGKLSSPDELLQIIKRID